MVAPAANPEVEAVGIAVVVVAIEETPVAVETEVEAVVEEVLVVVAIGDRHQRLQSKSTSPNSLLTNLLTWFKIVSSPLIPLNWTRTFISLKISVSKTAPKLLALKSRLDVLPMEALES